MDGAGCLVGLGLLLLLPAMLFSLVTVTTLVYGLYITVRATPLTEWSGLFRDWWHQAWQWLRGKSAGGSASPVLVLFLAMYFALFSQWIAFLLNWSPRISTPRLWALSSGYFLAAMAAFAVLTWPSGSSPVAIAIDSSEFGTWLATTLGLCALGGMFLCASLSLWVLSARARARSARIHAAANRNG